MVNVVLERKRAALLDLVKGQAWNIVAGQQGAIENWVVLIADGSDANARVLLRDLGVDAKVTTSGGAPSVVPVPRTDAIRIIRPYDAELADKLATPTPMKATALVVAFGGWSILGMGRSVGIALAAPSRGAPGRGPRVWSPTVGVRTVVLQRRPKRTGSRPRNVRSASPMASSASGRRWVFDSVLRASRARATRSPAPFTLPSPSAHEPFPPGASCSSASMARRRSATSARSSMA
jgi:hypothetical protein